MGGALEESQHVPAHISASPLGVQCSGPFQLSPPQSGAEVWALLLQNPGLRAVYDFLTLAYLTSSSSPTLDLPKCCFLRVPWDSLPPSHPLSSRIWGFGGGRKKH